MQRAGFVTLPFEERERTTPHGFSSCCATPKTEAAEPEHDLHFPESFHQGLKSAACRRDVPILPGAACVSVGSSIGWVPAF